MYIDKGGTIICLPKPLSTESKKNTTNFKKTIATQLRALIHQPYVDGVRFYYLKCSFGVVLFMLFQRIMFLSIFTQIKAVRMLYTLP